LASRSSRVSLSASSAMPPFVMCRCRVSCDISS
jgi:hypothetical protein